MTDFRREEIIYEPANNKGADELKLRDPRVFNSWQQDTPDTIRKCIEFDLKNMKLARLVLDNKVQEM